MNIIQTPTFGRQIKKLHANQKKDLDQAILDIMADVTIVDMKKSHLHGVRVYKFKMVKQLTLLAYEFDEYDLQLILLELGTHENFYRDLKR